MKFETIYKLYLVFLKILFSLRFWFDKFETFLAMYVFNIRVNNSSAG